MAHWFSHRTTHGATQAQTQTQAQSTPPQVARVDHKALLRLMNAVSGPFYLPGDAGYPAATAQSDPLFKRNPIAVAMCRNVADVQACVRWCNELGVSATFRSGGHSTAGFSVLDDTLTVDLSGLQDIVIDDTARTATVGSGVNFERLNAALDTHDLHVPGGGCGTVCVAGYMQGGGYGFTSRCFGMNCDHVSEVEFVTAKGEVQIANATTNTDLFWAFRGGSGGNFGVLTRITYMLHPLTEIWGFGLTWDLDDAAAALSVMQAEFMRGGPDVIGYMTFIMPRLDPTTKDYKLGLFMRGVCIAGRDKGMALLAPLVKTGGILDLDRMGSYAFLNGFLLADLEPQDLGSIYELKVSNYIDKKLLPTDWKDVVAIMKASPKTRAANANTLVLEPYGGRIDEVSARTDNAFIHRNVDMNMVIDSFYGPASEEPGARTWLERFRDFLRGPTGHSNMQVYQNYPEAGLPDWDKAYFAEALPRLQRIKWNIDGPTEAYPRGFFAYPQSLTPKPPQ